MAFNNNNHTDTPTAIKRAAKGYDNKQFIHSGDGRTIRLLAEYLYPLQQFESKHIERAIIFFGSARCRPHGGNGNPLTEKFYEDSRSLAKMLAEWSMELPKKQQFHICTGGGPGIMEAANRGAYEAGMESIGLNISLPHEQEPNPYIAHNLNFEFHYFFFRKFWFVNLASALIAFPGGFGTMDELMEILTLCQTRKVTKPLPIFLYSTEFWTKLVNFDYLIEMGMIEAEDMNLFKFLDSPEQAFKSITEDLTKIHLA